MRPRPALELRLLLLAPILFSFTLTVVDPDLWGMLAFGRDWAARVGVAAGDGVASGLGAALGGAIVTSDPYSYTSGDFPWIQHEWAIGPIFYLVYTIGGRIGLTLMKLALELGILAILLRQAAQQKVGLLGRWVLFLVALPAISFPLLTVRAGLFTAFFVALTCAIMLRARERPGALYALVPLTAIWINLHGGVVAGIGLVWLWWAATLLFDPPSGAGAAGGRRIWTRQTVPPLLLSLLALLVSPYGIRLPQFLASAAFMRRPMITEWQTVLSSPAIASIYVLWFGLCLLGWLATTRPRHTAEALVCLAAAGQAFMHLRHVGIAAIVCFAFSAGHISTGSAHLRSMAAERWPRAGRHLSPAGRAASQPATHVRAVAAGLAIVILLAALTNIPLWIDPPLEFPYAAVTTLKTANFSGNLLIDFNWGEFVINRMSPGVLVSFDGRFETAYPPGIAATHWAFYAGEPVGDLLLERFHTDGILLSPVWPACERLRENPDWEVAYEDDMAVIFLPTAPASTPRAPSTRSQVLEPATPTPLAWIPERSLWGAPTFRMPLLPDRPYVPR